MEQTRAVKQACDAGGGTAALARSLGVSQAAVSQWRSGARPVPLRHVMGICRFSRGVVHVRDLRPDDWHLIWPELAADSEQNPAPAGTTTAQAAINNVVIEESPNV